MEKIVLPDLKDLVKSKMQSQKTKNIHDVYLDDGVILNIEECDLSLLIEVRKLIVVQASDIQEQIDQAKSLAAAENIYADRRWFLLTQKTLRIKNIQIGIIDKRIKELKKTDKEDDQKHTNTFYQKYYNASKKILGKAIVELIQKEIDKQ